MIITSTTAAGDLWRLSATELAAAIRHRQVSAGEVVDAHLRRIDAVNSAVNAIVIRLDEQALDAAHEADRTAVGGTELPPFHGVPFTVKENIDVVGTPTTQGARALAGAYPTRDAPVESKPPRPSKTVSAPSRPSTRGNPYRGGRPDHR